VQGQEMEAATDQRRRLLGRPACWRSGSTRLPCPACPASQYRSNSGAGAAACSSLWQLAAAALGTLPWQARLERMRYTVLTAETGIAWQEPALHAAGAGRSFK